MKLEVGMFVRTELYGVSRIIYIDKEDKNWLELDNHRGNLIHKDTILKASHSLVGKYGADGVLEVEDYVNGHKIGKITKVPNEEIGVVIETDISELGGWETEPLTIYKEEIKTIVTKEQFEAIAYKVGE